jgi:hypothetical protein
MELHGAPPSPAQTPALYTTGSPLSPQPAKEREEDVKLHGPDGGPSPISSDSGSVHLIDAQQTGGALSHQPAEEREEDVELHGLVGGLSPTSSDSGSVHIWRCTFSSTC